MTRAPRKTKSRDGKMRMTLRAECRVDEFVYEQLQIIVKHSGNHKTVRSLLDCVFDTSLETFLQKFWLNAEGEQMRDLEELRDRLRPK